MPNGTEKNSGDTGSTRINAKTLTPISILVSAVIFSGSVLLYMKNAESALKDAFQSNESNINIHDVKIKSNEDDINTHGAKIESNENNISVHNVKIEEIVRRLNMTDARFDKIDDKLDTIYREVTK